ncbi:MAG: hypothetical protein AAF614_25880 [Chloroflexota bacterium]
MEAARSFLRRFYVRFGWYAVALPLGIFPLCLGLLWGSRLTDDGYAHLWLLRQTPALFFRASPYSYLLDWLSQLSGEAEQTAVFLSTIGWSVVGWLVFIWFYRLKRPFVALTIALLIVTSPLIWLHLGEGQSWTIAFAWGVGLLFWRLWRFPWQTAVFLQFALYLALLLAGQSSINDIVWQRPDPLLAFLQQSELYYLLPLLAAFGLLAIGRQVVRGQRLGDIYLLPLLVWSGLATATGLWAAGVVMLLVLAGRGVAALVDLLGEQPEMETAVSFLLLLFLGLAQFQSLQQLWQNRLPAQQTLENELLSWLAENTSPDSTLLAAARLGYQAQRATIVWPQQPETVALLSELQQQPLDTLVLPNSLPWNGVREHVWFRLNYERKTAVSDPAYPFSPLTVWQYRPLLTNAGKRQPIHVRVPDRFRLIGYQLVPQRFQPGDAVQVTLYLEALEATFLAPEPFQAVIRLLSAADNSTLQEWIVPLPLSLDVNEWQPNQLIAEQLTLQTSTDLEVGAYLLNLSLRDLEDESWWPLSLDNDVNQLDRVALDYIAVPWMGDTDASTVVDAAFGEQIKLVGFETNEPKAGDVFNVRLYWQALRPPEASYTVFVHLFNANGELVANHDGVPRNVRFPTQTWLPSDTIADTHPIPLPPDLPAGTYQLKTGLYLPETGERLTAVAADGNTPDDRAILLRDIEISE